MIIKFIKENIAKELSEKIQDNLELYRSGDFEFLETDPTASFYSKEKIEINLESLAKVSCENESDYREPENCKALYQALPINPYLARDHRLWIYLTHTHLLDYTRKRWPVPQDTEKAIKHIKAHFFVSGNRGLERNNSASRLWWMAHLCDRVQGISFEESLRSFLYKSDVRANIVERPTTSQSISIFSAIIIKLNESLKGDKSLFERTRFREFMKELNLQGGVRLLDVLDAQAINEIIEECI